MLEEELARLQNSLKHLVASNDMIVEAIGAEGDEDRSYKTAIEVRRPPPRPVHRLTALDLPLRPSFPYG